MYVFFSDDSRPMLDTSQVGLEFGDWTREIDLNLLICVQCFEVCQDLLDIPRGGILLWQNEAKKACLKHGIEWGQSFKQDFPSRYTVTVNLSDVLLFPAWMIEGKKKEPSFGKHAQWYRSDIGLMYVQNRRFGIPLRSGARGWMG